MAKIIIPTLNRSASLGRVLVFIAQYFPGTQIIIADGSAENYRALNRAAIAGPACSLDIDYRPYDPDLPFFDRILDVLCGLTDDLVVMGADDDYPQLDVLADAEEVLAAKPDHVSAFGAVIHLKLLDAVHMTARLDHAHPVTASTAARRAREFAEWPFSTTYAVTRRDHLIERYRRAKQSFLVGFYDYKTGVHDAVAGKLAVVPGFSYVSTHNFAHSYLRAGDRLVFLRHADEVLRIHDQFSADLVDSDGMLPEEATDLATTLIRKRVSALVDIPPHRRPGFETSPVYQLPIVRQQIADFYALFSNKSAVRSQLEPRLRCIVDSLMAVSASRDNFGEDATYETLAAQAERRVPSSETNSPKHRDATAESAKKVATPLARKPRAARAVNKVARQIPRIKSFLGVTPKPVPPLHFNVDPDSLVKE